MGVLLFDESNPTDGVVIGTYGTATWKQFDRLYASDGAPVPPGGRGGSRSATGTREEMRYARVSLLNDIQRDILDPSMALSVILRKALVLAFQLGNEEFKSWVEQELNGYPRDTEALPDYRILRGLESYGDFVGPFGKTARNLPIPTRHLPDDVRQFLIAVPFFDGIRALESMMDSEDEFIHFGWPADVMAALADKFVENMHCVMAWRLIPAAKL